jgi:hypothetical protein
MRHSAGSAFMLFVFIAGRHHRAKKNPSTW